MENKNKPLCDVYVDGSIPGEKLKSALKIVRNIQFEVDIGRVYSGYLGLNVKRLRAMIIVMRLRDIHVNSYNVPIEYRDKKNINLDDAREIVGAIQIDDGVRFVDSWRGQSCPLYWLFDRVDENEEKAGGGCFVDKIDGHVWSSDEVEEYQHDYNNLWR